MKNSVTVALSGGVDSFFAAHILNKKYDVEAIFMDMGNGEKDKIAAKHSASILQIPFSVIDIQEEFKKKIISYYLEQLKQGITPNPCVMCNRDIKFGIFFDRAKTDFIATGHYVRKKGDVLYRGKDKTKDQSYFLWALKKSQIERSIFPLGKFKKEKVKKYAKKLGLGEVPQSQELCFINNKTSSFLKENITSKEGNIVDKHGKVLGHHQGSFFYTVGQRKGLNLPGGPYYVLRKENSSVVVTNNEKDLERKEVFFDKANIIEKVELPIKVKAKLRYASPLIPGVLYKNKVVFSHPCWAVCPGQSVVFYKGEKLLGGGVITK